MNSKNNLISRSIKVKVGITIGDPSGIGPAITLKAVSRLKGLADFVIIGDKRVLEKTGCPLPSGKGVELLDLGNVRHKGFAFGQLKSGYGKASIEYLDRAIKLIYDDGIGCIVTCPISKEAINLAGCHYSGHTEYFAKQTKSRDFAMLLLNDALKFSLITRHIPLKDVSSRLNAEDITRNISLVVRSLRQMFGIGYPRIVVCGLNPHASDNGLIGDEEYKVIKPAIERSRKENRCTIHGPISADVAVHMAKQKKYDCIIAMYHDQALIPLKLSGGDTGVNLTCGLPFIRTSPLHGTAFDIAKRPKLADPSSLISAIRLAVKCVSNLKKD